MAALHRVQASGGGKLTLSTQVVIHTGTVEELHALPMPTIADDVGPQLWVMRPTNAAVVRGSAQKPELFDGEFLTSRGVALAGRRSGGAAVWIEPEQVVWIDVLAPRGSSLWSDELTETFRLVGRCWQRALAKLDVDAELVDAAPQRTSASDLACWAGHGWGEVVIDRAKIVGLSQRRTRWGARVQCMAVIDDSASKVANAFVGLSDRERADLRNVIGAVEVPVDRLQLETVATDTLLDAL